MSLWILIGLNIIAKVHGFPSGNIQNSCDDMSPHHARPDGLFYDPQNTVPPFELSCDKPGNKEDPITVVLKSKQPATKFKGFMLQALDTSGRPVGKFILLDSSKTRLLSCNGSEDSAVSHKNNQGKSSLQVNWMAPGADVNITFRATFLQTFDTFWKSVDAKDCTTTPTPTTQPTTSTVPSTIISTGPSTITSTGPSTITSTVPSTITSTGPSTITSTGPSTITSTGPSTITSTGPSTTISTVPSTTICTGQSNTICTTKPKTTEASMTTKQVVNSRSREVMERAGTVAIISVSFLVVLKMALSSICITALHNSLFSRCLNKVSQISCSLLCAALEISAVILFCVAEPIQVTLVALVCVAIVINFIELVIVCLPIEPSHELKEICEHAVKVCSVIHQIFTIAVIFVGVSDKCRKDWLLKVMVTFTVFFVLYAIWLFVSSTQRKAILGRSKLGGLQNRERGKLRAQVIVIAVSVIFTVGNLCFAVAVAVGMFGCHQE